MVHSGVAVIAEGEIAQGNGFDDRVRHDKAQRTPPQIATRAATTRPILCAAERRSSEKAAWSCARNACA